jgi:hypothetical protein
MSTDCGLCPLLTKIGRCRNFGKNPPVQNITNVHLVGIELFRAKKTEGRSGITKEGIGSCSAGAPAK